MALWTSPEDANEPIRAFTLGWEELTRLKINTEMKQLRKKKKKKHSSGRFTKAYQIVWCYPVSSHDAKYLQWYLIKFQVNIYTEGAKTYLHILRKERTVLKLKLQTAIHR